MRNFTALLGAAAMLSLFPATPALAQDGGATITKEDGCFGAVPDASGQLTGIFVTGSLISRSTKSGITTMTCHFDLSPEESPPRATRAAGFVCGTPIGLTSDTRISASPGGRMVMTCRIRR